jgi:hypothetical protein
MEKSDGLTAEACFGDVDSLGWADVFERLSDCESIDP